MSLFEHFFKVLNLYMEARIRIRDPHQREGRIRYLSYSGKKLKEEDEIRVVSNPNETDTVPVLTFLYEGNGDLQ
jgi:hypothetical protein